MSKIKSKRMYKDSPTIKSQGYFSEIVKDEQSGDNIEVIYKATIVDASEFECCSGSCGTRNNWYRPFEDVDVRVLKTNLDRFREITTAFGAGLINLDAGLSYLAFLRDDLIKTIDSCKNIFEQPYRSTYDRVNNPATRKKK